MLYVSTLFDSQRDSRPLFTAIYDTSIKSVKFFPLYLPKTGKTLYDIEQDKKLIAELLHDREGVCLNDYKQHLIGFGLDSLRISQVYDYPCDISTTIQQDDLKKILLRTIKSMQATGLQSWTLVRAKAAVVYRHMQGRGVYFAYDKVFPIWHMDTYTGRTRATGFEIQGLSENAPINSVHGDDFFLNFDWVSADLRVASILSGDENLVHSFKISDPYQYMADTMNEGLTGNGLTRSESKDMMFQSLYSMAHDSVAMKFYGRLGEWMYNSAHKLATDGAIPSILGREFEIVEGRSLKSAFNAVMQGSVAHAMQASLARVAEKYASNILTENHDSLVLTCRQRDNVKSIIGDVVDIMCRPFAGILESDPVFPVVVSVGKKYKGWKRLRRYDG